MSEVKESKEKKRNVSTKEKSGKDEKSEQEEESRPEIPMALDLTNSDEIRSEIKFLEHIPFVFTKQTKVNENGIDRGWSEFYCLHCDIKYNGQAVYRPTAWDPKTDEFTYSPFKFISLACIKRYNGDSRHIRKDVANSLLTLMALKKYKITRPIVAAPPKGARKVHGGKYTDEEFLQLIADRVRVEIVQDGMVQEKVYMTIQREDEYEKAKPVSSKPEEPKPSRIYSASLCEPILSGTSHPLRKYLDQEKML